MDKAARGEVAGYLDEGEAIFWLKRDATIISQGSVDQVSKAVCAYSVMKLRTEAEPRNVTTISDSTGSMTTLPRMSVKAPLSSPQSC